MTSRSSACLLVAALVAAGCGGSESAKPADKSAPASSAPAKAPLVSLKKAADWCKEHGVPESACTKCDASLVAGFKATGDWCDLHSLPKSQCVECDPTVAATLAAMAPK